MDYVLVYLDDILVIQKEGESEDDHLKKIDEVLSRLEKKGFRANLRKSFFMQKEVEYLGFLLTNEGVKPQSKKIEKFVSATAIDLSQGYYHLPLSKEAQKLLTTVLPWGKYAYKKIPMGLASAPDIFQKVMT